MGRKLRFAHLHQHTQFSLLDGAAKLSDLLKWVKETTPEDPALAITDHGNLFGAVEFYKKATAMGIKPILGYEAYVAAESRFDRKRGKGLDGGYFHLTLLAKDFRGYQNLVRLASRAYLEGFYEKPRIDREILREHAEGLIALSGCLGAEIPQFILQDRLDLAEARLNEYLSIFGDRFFIEIQNHGLPEQRKVNEVLKEFARKYGLGMVATNDGHYVRKEDARAHEVLLAIQSKSTLDDPERWRFPCDEFYVKTPEEMRAMLPEEEWGDEPFDNTVEIARMCDVDLPIGDKMVYRIPRFPLPEGRTEAQYLRELTFKGLLRRYPDRITEGFYREVFRLLGKLPPHGDGEALAEALAGVEEEAWERLMKALPPLEGVREWTAEAILHRALYELSVMERMGFPGYFLIVQDYINWARSHGISVGPGRGSAAGSLVAYAVGITNIDPLRFGLLFERFLNPERVSMPDIDTDFSDRERDRVIQYVRERYGEDKVAQIGTLGSLASKAALKDVARVYGIPHKRAEELAKLIPVQFGKPKPLAEAIQVVPELKAEMEKDPKVREVLEVAMRLEGLNRHASVHAAGVVIAAEPLTDLVPLMRDQEGRPVTQYDMGAVEALGLLKMDFLGLRTLTFLDEARRIVRESRGVELDYDRLPLDDAKTFELLSRGETKGVFQLESGGMTATVRGLKPRRIEDIIALVSLYRPGPMEHIPTYIRRHHGQEPVSYSEFPHAEKYLKPILDETYGIPVYQEQIMQIASQVAGYSLGEADLLRRAMGKKRVEEMQKHRERFVRGAKERGVPEEEANRLFDMLEAFANYGFNKCLPARARVVDWRTGRVVRVGEIVRGEVEEVWVVSLDEARLRLVPRPVVAAFPSGKAQVYALRTATGRVLEATANHPVYTPRGWRPLGALAPGDYVALPRHLPYRPSAHLEAHELDLLGFALAEGNLRHPSGFYLYTSSEEELAAMEEALRAFPNTRTRVVWRRGVAHVYVGRMDRRQEAGAVAFLRRMGLLGLDAKTKRLPEAVFGLPPEEVARFLGRLWTGDGGVDPKGRLIHYATASKELASGVQHLLLRLGLQSRLVEKRFSGGYKGYAVYLLGGLEAARRFAETVGPYLVGKRRQDLEALLASWGEAGQSTKDVLPLAFLEEVREAVAQGQAAALLREAGLRPGRGRRGLSRATVGRLAALTGSLSARTLISPHGTPGVGLCEGSFGAPALAQARAGYLALLRLAEAEVYWDRVEAVEPLGEEEVFDLTVEGTHTFVAEDVIVHNSHAAAYSLLSYQTAYVKAHYPVEFMAALLSVERHDSDKVAEYIRDARAMGIEVLPPDINRSGFDFKVVGEEILFGLSAVKNVGEAAAEAILKERERGGPFKSLGDFLKRLDEKVVNKRTLESLIKAGAMDAFGDRARLLASLDPLLRWAAGVRERERSGMWGLFAEVEEPPLQEAPPLDEITRLRYEKEALGIYVSGHPVLRYPGLREAASCTLEELPEFVRGLPPRSRVLLAGMVEDVVRKPTRSGGMMARFTLSDETGALEVVVFGRAYEGVSPKLKEDTPLLVLAEVEREEGGLRVIAQAAWTHEEVAEAAKALEVEVDHALLDEKGVALLKSLLDEHPGPLPLYVRVQGPFGEALFSLREARVGEEALGALEAEGFRAYLVPDREVFLQANGGNGSKEEAVPF
ncbi:DNA polymerase-3 subunit alpha [Thermus arciformis]|uniref:DNA polymerase III subunit alpha n=1 Tax=Thermus arciformis TaxID=482827 RepID=A0A1G7D815_9DEIN|nr:DNA polymerase III subunit alpha [Thermus arciformis]SDE47712.1 DNA polymerase-3 subunit alpha [Thermus arciformis]